MGKVDRPKYFIAHGMRHFVMSMEDFLAHTPEQIESLIATKGFKTEWPVTRVDDSDQNVVTFLQRVEGAFYGSSEEDTYFEGEGTGNNH